jgi:hypothetical protein
MTEEKEDAQWTEWCTPRVGMVWVCSVCGRVARTRSGEDLQGEETIVNGTHWDTSCFLHAVLCYEQKQDGKWQAVKDESK